MVCLVRWHNIPMRDGCIAEQLLSAVEPDDTQEGLVTLLNEIRHRKETPQWTNVQEWLASGEILQARVSAASKRMYVELPGGIYALTETVLEDTFGVGQTIDVRVVRVNRQKDRVHVERVALAAIDADPGQDHRPALRGIFQKQWCKRIDFCAACCLPIRRLGSTGFRPGPNGI